MAKAFLEQKGTGSHQPLQLPRSAARAPTPEADVGYTVNEVNGTVSVVDSDPGTGVFPVACPPHRHRPGARALTRTRCLRRHPPPSRSTEAETSHAEVKLGNGTVFGADAAFDFSNAQVKKVDKTAAITNHAEIKDGDSGQVSSANGTV